MAEYINKETVLEKIESASMWSRSFGELYEEVQELPSDDVAPVRHGRWEFNGISVSCSECGSNKPTKAQDHKLANKEISFCYFCGCKMDGDTDA